MKKVFLLCLASALTISAYLPQKAKAESVIDQQYTAGSASVVIDTYLGSFAQTFMPTKTRLDKVAIELTSVSGGNTATVSIRHFVVGSGWDAGNIAIVSNQALTNGWNTFDFADVATTISATETYGIWVVSNQNGPQWKYNLGPSTYDRGYAIWQSQDKADWDYNFKTYGYDPVADASTPAAESGQTLESSGETLGATTSSISKPSNLTAAYSDADRGAVLSWKASTTSDIDGYKIFRSEKQSSGFTKIKEVTKNVLKHTDQEVVSGKTYYYLARAFKSSSQSESSNTASVKIPEDIAPIKPVNLKVVNSTENLITVAWRKSEDPNISGYTISLYKNSNKIRTTELSSEHTSYSFLDLDPMTVYKVELIAKNAKSQTSTPAIAFGCTKLNETFAEIADASFTAAALGVFILLLILAIRTKKHYTGKK